MPFFLDTTREVVGESRSVRRCTVIFSSPPLKVVLDGFPLIEMGSAGVGHLVRGEFLRLKVLIPDTCSDFATGSLPALTVPTI